MSFEWDTRKARANRIKHGIEFEQARLAFDEPSAHIALDERHSTAGEVRQWLIGDSGAGLLVVVFVERPAGGVRIISARRAGRRDRRRYESQR